MDQNEPHSDFSLKSWKNFLKGIVNKKNGGLSLSSDVAKITDDDNRKRHVFIHILFTFYQSMVV